MSTTVLVVDDSRVVRTLVRAVLSEMGLEAIEAEDGVQGLATARQTDIDFFLIDLVMPEMGGIELTREIRKIERYAKTPIFVLTTEGHGALAAEGTAAGADSWIVKPFEPDRLIIAIQKALGRSEAGTE